MTTVDRDSGGTRPDVVGWNVIFLLSGEITMEGIFDFQAVNSSAGLKTGYRKMRELIGICCFVLIFASPVRSQDGDKALSLFEDAVEAMGGEAFLNVRDMVSDGNYFIFNRDGASSPLIKFKDYTKLPDKSRHELGNKKKELEITVFNLGKNEGWILEGQKDTRDATPDEMRDFKNAVKHSIETIFRYRYKDPDTKKFYLGPGTGSDVTLEMVKLVDPENDEVTVYIDRITKLPVKIEFKNVTKKGVRQRVVNEFSNWHVIQGVNTPLRIDGYANGRRAFQQFIIHIEYNTNIPDSTFSKPVPPK